MLRSFGCEFPLIGVRGITQLVQLGYCIDSRVGLL